MKINHNELQPGQWITFSYAAHSILDVLKQPFKVLARKDFTNDKGVCWLMSVEGALYHYDPGASTLSLCEIPRNHEVHLISSRDLQKELGESFRKVETLTKAFLRNFALECEDFDTTYDPNEDGRLLTREQFLQRCGVSLEEKQYDPFPSFTTPHLVH